MEHSTKMEKKLDLMFILNETIDHLAMAVFVGVVMC